jgi:hypothetical protein
MCTALLELLLFVVAAIYEAVKGSCGVVGDSTREDPFNVIVHATGQIPGGSLSRALALVLDEVELEAALPPRLPPRRPTSVPTSSLVGLKGLIRLACRRKRMIRRIAGLDQLERNDRNKMEGKSDDVTPK